MQYYGTLGPACGDVDVLIRMFQAGMTGIRLNLSHGDLEENGRWLEFLERAADRCGAAPEILMDLRGPELRLGKFGGEIFLRADGIVGLTCGAVREPAGESITLAVPPVFLEYAKPGDHILIDDGKIELEVLADQAWETLQRPADMPKGRKGRNSRGGAPKPSCGRSEGLSARVIRGGPVKEEKSLAIVGKELPMPTLTESDYRNIGQALRYGVTGVMLPFVRCKEDLQALRGALREAGAGRIKIFAKIENMQGVQKLEELLPHADHIVIARGDLGNAMPLWELPRVQKQISAACRAAGKPFMVVTQMLDSMHERAVPTRAEVADIYNAVLDGAASLMLTGETAAGRYPAEAMEYLVRTGEEAKKQAEKQAEQEKSKRI